MPAFLFIVVMLSASVVGWAASLLDSLNPVKENKQMNEKSQALPVELGVGLQSGHRSSPQDRAEGSLDKPGQVRAGCLVT